MKSKAFSKGALLDIKFGSFSTIACSFSIRLHFRNVHGNGNFIQSSIAEVLGPSVF